MERRVFILGVGAAAVAGRVIAADDTALLGTWSGVLEAGGQKLRLRLELAADSKATIYSLDQGNQPIPARIVALTRESMELTVEIIGGGYAAKVVSPDRLEGYWRQAGKLLPLTFVRGESLLAGAAAPPPKAVTPLTQAVLDDERKNANLPALGAAAARRGGAKKIWVSGERVSGSGAKVAREDQWHLGSITKSTTATLVARLVDAGAIHWDDTVGNLLERVAPDMNEAYQSVTFRHLLCHRAGLQANLPIEDLIKYSRDDGDAREERRKYVRAALSLKPIGPKETTFMYANNGYVVIGAMLEAKLDTSWEDLMRKHVFEPLHLASAGFGAPGEKGKITQPAGHVFDGATHTAARIGEGPSDNPTVLGPAGRVHMSFDDLLTYLAAHRDATSFLKAESWKTLHTPPFGGEYACGWVVRADGSLWHNGSNTLWIAEVSFDSRNGVVAAAACNEFRSEAGAAVGWALKCAAAAA
jgi:CubicO group peptidase (beta-lactamase class C family)